ncbi:MAG: polyprenyl synthetase family protein [Anaerolineales bacterium]|nr:polyprenyl synthetase family protein [Anaerolineales bacterium]
MTNLIRLILPSIESELQRQIAWLDEPPTRPFHEMLTYHMGWTGEGAGAEATGKRIRPLLLLLTTASCGADTSTTLNASWQFALPAAACMELIHNFSLVHDDINDKFPPDRVFRAGQVLQNTCLNLTRQLRIAMFATGAENIESLSPIHLIRVK